MARPLRIDVPDGLYHVTSRGLERRRVVRDDTDRLAWTRMLERVATRRGWRVLAWVLMDNHFHLFLRVPDGDLSGGMHDLNAGYATRFNLRHARSGPLFQGRFKGILVEREYHCWELTRYIHLNPVRAGVVADPEAYRWGSCRCYFESRTAPPWLAWQEVLAEHGRTLRAARGEYRAFLREGIAAAPRSPIADATASVLLGSQSFLEAMSRWLRGRLPEQDVPAAREIRRSASLGDVERAVCAAYRVPAEALRARGKHRNEPRVAAIYLGRTLGRVPVRAVGERFGGVGATAVSNIVRKAEVRRKRDSGFAARLESVEQALGKNEK